MQIKKFRKSEFINREKEIKFFLDYFNEVPERILWVYGPKSTGKTTLIEYIVENHLLKDKSYNVKYINFRGKMVTNYDNFISAFIKPDTKENFFKDVNLTLDLTFIKINSKLYERIKKKEYDFFEAMEDEFLSKARDKKSILIIDEIQTLQDIYLNGGRLLLNEFLNFCVRLTKETHSSHVVILTSNTLFLDKIYNNSKLKVTSKFKLIDHLEYHPINKWLKTKGFSKEDIDLIYEYFGGSSAHIKKLLEEYKYFNSIKEYLEEETEIAKNEIIFEKNRITNKEFNLFLEIAKIIVNRGYYIFDEEDEEKRKNLKEVIERFCDVEILFFDPLKNLIRANSRIYIKAFEKILNS
ncbi:MAG TPA: AAA family ATPase [Nautiliaceae bacterium]|nr:AAA family ATPase [Nautiliaceae bacterium]